MEKFCIFHVVSRFATDVPLGRRRHKQAGSVVQCACVVVTDDRLMRDNLHDVSANVVVLCRITVSATSVVDVGFISDSPFVGVKPAHDMHFPVYTYDLLGRPYVVTGCLIKCS